MLELMSSTLERHIYDVVAGFVGASELTSVHNTLRDLNLWVKEPLEDHFLRFLFPYIDQATARTYLHSPLFHTRDILLNVGSYLHHLNVRSNRRALRIHIQERLVELGVR